MTDTTPPTGTLARGLLLLELVAQEHDGIALGHLADRAGLDKGSASRLVSSLMALGYLTRRDDRRITLTSRVLTLAHGFETGFDLKRLARPVLWSLSAELGETVHLAVPERSQVVYADSLRPRRETAFAAITGLSADMHVTATGRALLYHLPEADREAIIAENVADPQDPALVFDRAGFDKGAEFERLNGFVTIDRNDHIARVAVALLDEFRRPVAAVGIFSLAGNDPELVERLGRACLNAVAQIQRRLTGSQR
ncbi:IclR family transcriptional regulator [Plantibacter sp. VKM Ac-2885]|uniref:IclR family transcriptional regulator n=1 Tax=Plantibacter sp. VKM Ac-2885 TaxID=2783828 RepID=UPI00188B9F30|nr:IclR family transcriptional regulator [Plantibacter sp. VKM Ac-2885]MBF4514101.1 IclR family transcriptional regulator [Plantibacter sp. VKM Ac-2885]